MEISLPGEQVQPLPKMANKNRKNNQKNKPNGFICFANSQRKELASQYNIRGPQMLVQLCDPLWRKLTPEEKKVWNQKAKEEHARNTGRKPTDPGLRMDCNRKIISERQDAERAQIMRRNREQRFVREELERCEEVMEKEFYIIDALSIVEYLDGEFVPCEVGVVKCTIKDGIIGHYHFFPDPGPLRAGFFAEALERCDLEHEIKPKDFPLASNDYELDVSKMIDLMNLRSPKTPFIFARSSEAKRAESCLEWLGFRVNQEFRPKVMELESFIEELITATRNQPPTFAQIRRLLFETKFDFVRGNRCDFHSQTDKIACSIGNVKKYLYFMCEMLYDYYEFDLLEGRHFPLGYEASSCPSRPSLSTPSSIIGDDGLDEISSLASSFSIGSYEHKRNVEHPRKPDNSFSNRKIANDIPSSGSSISARSSKSLPNSSAPNSFSNINSSQYSDSHIRTADSNVNDTWSIHSEPPRRPNSTDCRKPMSTPINAAYVSGVNSFASGVSPSYNHPQQRAAQYGNSSVKSPQQNSLHNHPQSLHSFSSPTHTSQYFTNSNTPNPYSNPPTSYNNPSSHHNNSLRPHNMSSSSHQTSGSTSHDSSYNYNNNNNNNNNDNNSNSPSNYNNNSNNSNNPSNYYNNNLHSSSPHRDSISSPLTGLSPASSLGRSRGRGLSSSSPLGASSTLPPSIPTTSRGRARGTVPAAPLPRRPNVCPSKAKDRT